MKFVLLCCLFVFSSAYDVRQRVSDGKVHKWVVSRMAENLDQEQSKVEDMISKISTTALRTLDRRQTEELLIKLIRHLQQDKRNARSLTKNLLEDTEILLKKLLKKRQRQLRRGLDIGLPNLKFVLERSDANDDRSPSILKLWEKIREYFKNLGLEIQEKFFNFAEWVRTTVKGGIEKVKDKVEKLKIIAREIINNSKSMTKEVAREALEYFQPFKDDLGLMWDDLKKATSRVIAESRY